MEAQPPQNQTGETHDLSAATDLAPLNIIRAESELSKYPIHNLAKKGRVDIRILKKTPTGDVDLRWEVSYSDRYGQPRQLAYKLDTIVINRRIEELGRPLPKVIRLGSLRELAADLDLGGSGASTNQIKRALYQDAFAAITAKLRYRGNDGTERTLEAGFTRYSIVFTGQRLPDGTKADGVFIILSDPYRAVLDTAPARPLDYDYLKMLPPAAQRFYEIVSRLFFAALKHNLPHAKIPYSEFCTYSALTRHMDHENFRVQMAKIHRPHLKSGYLAKVRYEEMRDDESKPDWMMFYTPGAKARAEYNAFTKGRKPHIVDAKEGRPGAGERAFTPKQRSLPLKRETAPIDVEALTELTRRGVSATRAVKLLSAAAPGQPILDQLEWGDYLIRQAEPGAFRNPPGFYIYLVAQNLIPPDNFQATRKRKVREDAERAQAAQQQKRLRLEIEYDDYRQAAVTAYIADRLGEAQFRELVQTKAIERRQQYRNLPRETITKIAERDARAEIAKLIALPTFEAFCQGQEKTAAAAETKASGV